MDESIAEMIWEDRVDPTRYKELLPTLIAELKTGDEHSSSKAAMALAKMGPVGLQALPELKQSLQHEFGLVRVNAASAIWELTQSPSAVIRTLEDALEDSNHMVRNWAGGILAVSEPRVPELIPALIKMLSCPDAGVRCHGAMGLKNLGKMAAVALPALIQKMNDPDELVQVEVKRAMDAIQKASR